MSQDKQKSIAAMRTFARDMSRQEGTGAVADTEAATKPKQTSADKAAHTAAAPIARPAPKPTTTSKVTAAHIPSFHELTKHAKSTPDAPTLKAAISQQAKAGAVSPSGGGTIITDTKIERTSFFAALSKSLTQWFADVKKQLKPKKKRTYSVTSTERRKGVVQKATSKTGAIFSANKAELEEIIRKRQREVAASTDEPEIEWTPFTEPGFLLLDGEHETLVKAQVKEEHKTPTEPPVTKSTGGFVPPPPAVAPVAVTPPPIPPPTITITPPVAPPAPPITVTPTDDPVEQVPDDEVEVATPAEAITTENDAALAAEQPTVPWWSLDHLYNLTTNEMTGLAVGVLLVLSLGGYLGFVIMSPQPTTPTEATAVTIAPLTTAPLIAVSTSSAPLTERVLSVPITTTPTELYIGDRSAEIPGGSSLTSIVTQSGMTFAQTVNTLRLVVTGDGTRSFILRVDDSINARGGLLEWEAALYRDIAPLMYNTPTQVAANYEDAIVNGIDTRNLVVDGGVVIVYGFVNDNTVVIAPNEAVFSSIISLLLP